MRALPRRWNFRRGVSRQTLEMLSLSRARPPGGAQGTPRAGHLPRVLLCDRHAISALVVVIIVTRATISAAVPRTNRHQDQTEAKIQGSLSESHIKPALHNKQRQHRKHEQKHRKKNDCQTYAIWRSILHGFWKHFGIKNSCKK